MKNTSILNKERLHRLLTGALFLFIPIILRSYNPHMSILMAEHMQYTALSGCITALLILAFYGLNKQGLQLALKSFAITGTLTLSVMLYSHGFITPTIGVF